MFLCLNSEKPRHAVRVDIITTSNQAILLIEAEGIYGGDTRFGVGKNGNVEINDALCPLYPVSLAVPCCNQLYPEQPLHALYPPATLLRPLLHMVFHQ